MSDDNYTNGRVCENRVGNDAVLNGQVSSFGEVSRHDLERSWRRCTSL